MSIVHLDLKSLEVAGTYLAPSAPLRCRTPLPPATLLCPSPDAPSAEQLSFTSSRDRSIIRQISSIESLICFAASVLLINVSLQEQKHVAGSPFFPAWAWCQDKEWPRNDPRRRRILVQSVCFEFWMFQVNRLQDRLEDCINNLPYSRLVQGRLLGRATLIYCIDGFN